MKKQLIYTCFAGSAMTSTLTAAPAYGGEWHKSRLFTIFSHLSRDLPTNTEFQFVKDNNWISMTEKTASFRGYNVDGMEQAAVITANRVHADNGRHQNTYIKSGRSLYYELMIDARWFRDNKPQYTYGFDSVHNVGKLNASIADARKIWINQVNTRIRNSRNNRMGLFMDSTRTTSSTGALDYTWGESMLRGVNGYTIANGYDPDGEAKILTGHETLKSTDSIWVEDFFRGRMSPSDPTEQVNVLTSLSYVDDTKQMIYAGSGQHNEFQNQFDTAFRANLLVANENSLFSWFNFENIEEDLDFYDSDYGRRTGDPLAAARNDRYKFTRVFENCTVTYDASNQRSSLVWNQNNREPGATHLVYQAERTSRIHRGSIKTNSLASDSSYADLNGGGQVKWNGVNADGGETIVSFRVKCPTGTRRMGVYVNGAKQAVISHNKNDWTAKSVRLVLKSGSNNIHLRDSEGTAEFDVDYMAFPRSSSRYVGPLQAEDAVSTSSFLKTDRVAARDKYEDGNQGMNLTWYARSTGVTRNLSFRVKVPSGSRKMGVYVNGAKVGTIATSSRTWTSQSVNNVKLKNGLNKIELRDSENTLEFDVDYMIIKNH